MPLDLTKYDPENEQGHLVYLRVSHRYRRYDENGKINPLGKRLAAAVADIYMCLKIIVQLEGELRESNKRERQLRQYYGSAQIRVLCTNNDNKPDTMMTLDEYAQYLKGKNDVT